MTRGLCLSRPTVFPFTFQEAEWMTSHLSICLVSTSPPHRTYGIWLIQSRYHCECQRRPRRKRHHASQIAGNEPHHEAELPYPPCRILREYDLVITWSTRVPDLRILVADLENQGARELAKHINPSGDRTIRKYHCCLYDIKPYPYL